MSMTGNELSDLRTALMSGHLSNCTEDCEMDSKLRKRRSRTVYKNDVVHLPKLVYRPTIEIFDQQLMRINENDDLEQLECSNLGNNEPGDGPGSTDAEEIDDLQSDSSEDDESLFSSHLSNYDPRLLSDGIYREEPEDFMDYYNDCVDMGYVEEGDEADIDSMDDSTDSERDIQEYSDNYAPTCYNRHIVHALLSGNYMHNLEDLDRLAQEQPGSFISARTIDRPIMTRIPKSEVKDKLSRSNKDYSPSPLSYEVRREDIPSDVE